MNLSFDTHTKLESPARFAPVHQLGASGSSDLCVAACSCTALALGCFSLLEAAKRKGRPRNSTNHAIYFCHGANDKYCTSGMGNTLTLADTCEPSRAARLMRRQGGQLGALLSHPPGGRTYGTRIQVAGQQSGMMDTVAARFRAAVQVTPRADKVYALPAVDEQVHAGSGSSAPGGQDSRPTECVHPRSTPRSKAPWLEMARPRPSC